MLSVVVVGVVAAAMALIDPLRLGIENLALDVKELLSGEESGSNPVGDGGSSPYVPPPSNPGGGSIPGGTESGGEGTAEEGSGDSGSGDSSSEDGSASTSEEPEEPVECPYVYDEASNRWRDPETGQYVSQADASSAGC